MAHIDWPAWIQAASAFAIVIITGYYTYYASQQVKQMKEAVRVAKDAANAAQKSADAAKASADDLPKVERAYLSIFISTDVANWKNARADELSPVKVKVTNYGKTPAKVKEIIINMGISKSDGITVSKGIPDIDEIKTAVGHYIRGNDSEEFEHPVHISNLIDEWEGSGEGRYFIKCFGEVRYSDIFAVDHTAFFDWWLISSSYERGFHISDSEANYTT